MKYSVVIPTYNAAQTLSRALDSCLAQSIPPLEIIIVDDASTDETISVVNRYKDFEAVRLIQHKHNLGVSSARNTGWESAKGEWVAFLDSDDEWHRQKIELLSPVLKDQNVAFVVHHFQYEPCSIRQPSSSIDPVSINNLSFTSLLLHNRIATCTVMVRRSFLLRYDESMRYCEDHDFLLRSAYHSEIRVAPISLAMVHRKINSPGGLSGDLWKMRQGEIHMYSKLYKLNVLFILITPILMFYSIFKHLIKILFKK